MHRLVYEELLAACSVCEDGSSHALPNGTRLIRNLPDQGPLAFLHCLYRPLDQIEWERCQEILGRPLPKELGAFLVKANGATLYDKTIFLFGLAENITRSLDLEKQTAISIVWQNEVFASSYPKRWRDGWTHIGALTGYSTSLSLQAHLDGPCEVVWDNGLSVGFASFDSMLTTLVALVAPCFTCTGIRDQTYKELESTLDQLRSMR